MPTKKICCNPFKIPQHSWVKKNISKCDAACKERFPDIGEYICMSCKLLISKKNDPPKRGYVSSEIDYNDNNSILSLNESPSISPISDFDPEYIQDDFGREIMNLVKQKFKTASTLREKIVWLTVTPLTWNVVKLQKEFGISYKFALHAKNVQGEFGFGSYPPKKECNIFSNVESEKIVNFYLSDEISRIMPGQKDVVSVPQENGKKVKLQKHLILCNVKEAYVAFKKDYPEINVGFSKFASLRPKQCVLADSNGTHNVCVCKIYQNFKLLLNGLKSIFHEI